MLAFSRMEWTDHPKALRAPDYPRLMGNPSTLSIVGRRVAAR
jgi:hypothetical protein